MIQTQNTMHTKTKRVSILRLLSPFGDSCSIYYSYHRVHYQQRIGMTAVVYRLVGQYHRLELQVQWTDLIGIHFVIPLIYQTEKEVFDEEMFDIAKLYITLLALLYAVQPIRLYPVLMSILLQSFKQLHGCISQVEQLMVKVEGLQKIDSPPQFKLFDF